MSSAPRDPTDPPGKMPEDAETAFNAWLDATFAGQTAVPEHARSAETIAARTLQGLAAEEDAALAHATTAHPWKEILMSSHPIATTPPTITSGDVRVTSSPRDRSRFGRMINRTISIAAVLAIFIAGFATAWIARDRFGSDHEPPVLQIAASPSTQVTCTTRTLSQEEVDRIVEKYQDARITVDHLRLSDKPVAEADALAAIETYRATQTCPAGDPSVDNRYWLYSTETEGNLALRNLARSPSWNIEGLTGYKPIVEPISRMLVPAPASNYVVNSGDPAIKPYAIVVVGVGTVVLLPSRFVQLADGQIGAPMLWDVSVSGPSRNLSRITVGFILFQQVNGRWLFNGTIPLLCPEDCSAAQGLIDQQIAYYQRLEATAASPVAPPDASPEASPKS